RKKEYSREVPLRWHLRGATTLAPPARTGLISGGANVVAPPESRMQRYRPSRTMRLSLRSSVNARFTVRVDRPVHFTRSAQLRRTSRPPYRQDVRRIFR